MSKFPNLWIPAIGGTALVLGVAYGVATKKYSDDRIRAMEGQVALAQSAMVKTEAEIGVYLERVAELEAVVATFESNLHSTMNDGRSVSQPATLLSAKYKLGRRALPAEIIAWDVDVLPDGRGLPKGRGTVFEGEQEFAEHCASCHGDFAEGVDNWPVLAGGFDTLADEDPVKTVGSYWPYLSTVWDYVHRSMPFGAAQTLSDDQVYAIVAYILYSNDLVEEEFELNHENFGEFQMHNSEGFIIDDRSDVEYTLWRNEPCMENCKQNVEITMRASVLDVTPEIESIMEEENALIGTALVDSGLLKAGEKVFKKCQACHQIGTGASNKVGPHLNDIFGREMGGLDDFKYSNVFRIAAEENRIWDEESMVAFLSKPNDYLEGTKMAFAGLKRAEDLEAIVAYLRSGGN